MSDAHVGAEAADDGAALFEHLAPQRLFPALVGLGSPCRQLPALTIRADQHDLIRARKADAGGAVAASGRCERWPMPGHEPFLIAGVTDELLAFGGGWVGHASC